MYISDNITADNLKDGSLCAVFEVNASVAWKHVTKYA